MTASADVKNEILERCEKLRAALSLMIARLLQAEAILRMLVEAASADKLEDFSRTSNVADMAADFLSQSVKSAAPQDIPLKRAEAVSEPDVVSLGAPAAAAPRDKEGR